MFYISKITNLIHCGDVYLPPLVDLEYKIGLEGVHSTHIIYRIDIAIHSIYVNNQNVYPL